MYNYTSLQAGEQSSLCLLKSLQERLNDICYIQSTLQCPLTLSEHEKVKGHHLYKLDMSCVDKGSSVLQAKYL